MSVAGRRLPIYMLGFRGNGYRSLLARYLHFYSLHLKISSIRAIWLDAE
jgi:hypothetical protein